MVNIKNGLFLFHRDLRINDNVGLYYANQDCSKLYTCFIFTPQQVGESNDYKSDNAIQFMIESLDELVKEIGKEGGNLMTFYGNQESVLKILVEKLQIECIYFNKDYSPFALSRDEATNELCKKMNISCKMYSDYYLFEPGTIVSRGSNQAYKKYTPFYEEVIHQSVDLPLKKGKYNFAKSNILLENKISLETAFSKFTHSNNYILVHGGRVNGLERLKLALQKQKKYDENRDFFIYETSYLSSYIKFGCVSIREVYHAFRKQFGLKHGLIRELIWREFFAHVLYAYPEVVGKSYQPKYRNLKWHNSKVAFKKWMMGKTGFPIVDACMRELNTRGYMHNRGRMMVASFLIKVLLIDWRWGEKYFAQKLTDYDIASNNGNWQGISGTGVDMKPYFRDMNPWIQCQKFDPDAVYIKKWIPELESVESKDIHNWHTACELDKYKNVIAKYPKPMVDYNVQKEKMLSFYKSVG
jgi:deoxyribodipyrimidine photo-lyase